MEIILYVFPILPPKVYLDWSQVVNSSFLITTQRLPWGKMIGHWLSLYHLVASLISLNLIFIFVNYYTLFFLAELLLRLIILS